MELGPVPDEPHGTPQAKSNTPAKPKQSAAAKPGATLIDNWNKGGCGFTDTIRFSLKRETAIGQFRTWINWPKGVATVDYTITRKGNRIQCGQCAAGQFAIPISNPGARGSITGTGRLKQAPTPSRPPSSGFARTEPASAMVISRFMPRQVRLIRAGTLMLQVLAAMRVFKGSITTMKMRAVILPAICQAEASSRANPLAPGRLVICHQAMLMWCDLD